MANITNKQVVDKIIEKGSPILKMAMKDVDTSNNEKVYEVLTSFETIQNEFISSLMNRIVKVEFCNRIFKNPLKMFHGGLIENGNGIQEIFVGMSKKRGFKENFATTGGSSENNLIGKEVPQVDVDYHVKNFEYKYKVSVSELQLKQAFLNDNGLRNLCNELINANLTGAYLDEYTDMKNILTRVTPVNANGLNQGKGVIQLISESTQIKDKAIIKLGKSYSPQMVCEKVRTYAGKLMFPTANYNLANVITSTPKEELVFFTTPEIEAKIDVNVLAQAFNVSSADVNVRTVIIDSFEKIGADNVIGVLADSYIIRAFDLINTSKTFENGESLYTNFFLHKQGIMTHSKFAQCVVFTDGTI